MKLKTLGYCTVALILLVVGYQKYSEYQTLRFINNFEECVGAKGSIVQYSYPATCITGLGVHFSQPVKVTIPPNSTPLPISVENMPKNWNTYKSNSYRFMFEYPPNWKVTEIPINPEVAGLLMIDTGVDSKHYSPEVTNYMIYLYKHNNLPTLYTPINRRINNTLFIEDINIELYPMLTYYLTIPNTDNYLQFLFGPYERESISQSQTEYQEYFYQVLSTFKFLDVDQTL